jgi:N6-L-threonylcarbamoyladenine synthase
VPGEANAAPTSDAYDKAARFLDVSFGNATSGGQAIEQLAHNGPPPGFKFPVPSPGQLAFSYSGLKSAVKRKIGDKELSLEEKREIAIAFQIAAVGQLEEKLALALEHVKSEPLSALVASGGVASNSYLRERLRKCIVHSGRPEMRLLCPPVALCTDNAAMIAWAALERYRRGMLDNSDSPIKPKWPIVDCADMSTS